MKSADIILRTTNINDLSLLRHWDKQPHVVACDPNADWNWEVELQQYPVWREQLIAELNGRPIGIIQIIDPAKEDSHYWGEIEQNLRAIDIWIGEETDLSKGYGTVMMRQAMDRCFADENVTAILIDPLKSNVKAHNFYEKLGFRFVEERWFDQDLCFVYVFERSGWKTE